MKTQIPSTLCFFIFFFMSTTTLLTPTTAFNPPPPSTAFNPPPPSTAFKPPPPSTAFKPPPPSTAFNPPPPSTAFNPPPPSTAFKPPPPSTAFNPPPPSTAFKPPPPSTAFKPPPPSTAFNPPPPSTAFKPPPPSTASNPPPPSNDTDFIRTNCNITLYPKTCFNSLSAYSSTIQRDPGRLAYVAINVTLSKTKHMAKHITNLTHQANYSGNPPRVAAALKDCQSLFGDAVYECKDSLRQMSQLNGTGGALRFQISNVQTWMSAALTNLETCTDGFEGVPEGGVKGDVCSQTVKVKEMTSNALALVNSFSNKT